MMKLFDRLVLLAVLLTFCVVVLGAYVRLSDAGLGCPDWPGCYGHLTVPQSESALAHVEKAFPHKPLETHKAWKEMTHRYFAGTLGLLILAIFIIGWRNRRRLHTPTILPTILLLVVTFQAALGMWTVTMLLKPVIVSAHLLGGMTTLALLTWLAHRRFGTIPSIYGANFNTLRPWARLGLIVIATQIFLGGWTSSNYAALACTDFPTCQGSLLPPMDFANAFHMIRELGETADGEQLSLAALTAIHWAHRLGALVTFLYLGWLAIKTMRTPRLGDLGVAIAGLLAVQITLGISNVMFSLPLPVAVAHNAVAALLLISLVVLNSKTTMRSGR
jgi:cytochrome c oxidase assembly protein subunit 15